MMKGYEAWGVCATVDPVDANNTDTSSDVVDMSKWEEVLVIISLGVLNDSATNTVTVKESATSGGTYTAISGKSQAIVGTDDAKIFIIRVGAEEMTYRYLKVTQDNSAHSQLMAIIVLGKAKYPPATNDDLSDVQTIVD